MRFLLIAALAMGCGDEQGHPPGPPPMARSACPPETRMACLAEIPCHVNICPAGHRCVTLDGLLGVFCEEIPDASVSDPRAADAGGDGDGL